MAREGLGYLAAREGLGDLAAPPLTREALGDLGDLAAPDMRQVRMRGKQRVLNAKGT